MDLEFYSYLQWPPDRPGILHLPPVTSRWTWNFTSTSSDPQIGLEFYIYLQWPPDRPGILHLPPVTSRWAWNLMSISSNPRWDWNFMSPYHDPQKGLTGLLYLATVTSGQELQIKLAETLTQSVFEPNLQSTAAYSSHTQDSDRTDPWKRTRGPQDSKRMWWNRRGKVTIWAKGQGSTGQGDKG